MTRMTKSLFIQFRIKKSVYKIAKKQIKWGDDLKLLKLMYKQVT